MTGLARRCLRCGQLVRGTCTACESARQSARERGTTVQRGYGKAHQRARSALLPAAVGTRCPLARPGCDGVMTDPARMDLHHSDPAARLRGEPGDVIVCSPCNRSLGDRSPADGRHAASRFLVQDRPETPGSTPEPITLPPSSPSVTQGPVFA